MGWDSSSGSSGDSSDSLVSDSLNQDSSSVDPSGSADSSGWKASGSSGSFMNNLAWLCLAALLCGCLGAIAAAMMGKPKPKPKKKAAPAPAPAPAPEPLPVLEPLMPVSTVSTAVPSYSYVTPATTAYAQPAVYAQPATTSYVQPLATVPTYAANTAFAPAGV